MGPQNRKHTDGSEPLPRPAHWLAVWALALFMVACTGGSAVEPVGEAEEMSVEEFEAVVSEAFSAVVDAPSVVMVREDYDRQGELITRVWTDTRPEEAALVQFHPAHDEESDPEIHAAVQTEASFAMAGSRFDDRWTMRDAGMGPVAPPRQIGIDYVEAPLLPDDDSMREGITVTRQDMSDGGTNWSASMQADSGASQHWDIHPDGYLRGFRFDLAEVEELGGAPPPAGMTALSEATIRPVDDPAPLPEPEEGEPMDLSVFPLPDDFISEPEPGSTAG